jgi:hypothetical protein
MTSTQALRLGYERANAECVRLTVALRTLNSGSSEARLMEIHALKARLEQCDAEVASLR